MKRKPTLLDLESQQQQIIQAFTPLLPLTGLVYTVRRYFDKQALGGLPFALDDNLDAPVVGATLRAAVVGHRPGLPIADGPDFLGWNAALD